MMTLVTPLTSLGSLSGPDRSRFDITGGRLTFMTDFTPNYEMPADDNMDNTYEVMVVATVGRHVRHQGREGHGHQRR